jgi:hypothetical protein
VKIKNILIDSKKPVLFRVAKGVDRPHQPRFALGHAAVLLRQIGALLQRKSPTRGIENIFAPLNQSRLREHLAAVLKMQQHRGDAAIVVIGVEGE